MTVAFVQVRGPQQYYCEDLVFAEAMGGFAERVVCVMLVVLHSCTDSRSGSLFTYHGPRVSDISKRAAINTYVHASAVNPVNSAYTAMQAGRASRW